MNVTFSLTDEQQKSAMLPEPPADRTWKVHGLELPACPMPKHWPATYEEIAEYIDWMEDVIVAAKKQGANAYWVQDELMIEVPAQ